MKKLIELLLKLLGFFKKEDDKREQKPQPPIVEAPKPNPEPPFDEHTAEPAFSSEKGTITSFLWKPESDTNPKVTVISVSSDTLKAADVRIQIKDKKGKIVKGNEEYNKGGNLRANRLPNHKYGRFNFKPGKKASEFAKLAPLTVSFFVELGGVRLPVKVMGKDSIVVKDPKQRLDLK